MYNLRRDTVPRRPGAGTSAVAQ